MQREQLEKIRSMPAEEVKATLVDFLTEFPAASVQSLLEAISKLETAAPQSKAEIAAQMITLVAQNPEQELHLEELCALMGFKNITEEARFVYWTLLDFGFLDRVISKKMGTQLGKGLPQDLVELLQRTGSDAARLLAAHSPIVELS